MKIAVHHLENLRKDSFANKWIKYLEEEDVDVLKLDLTKGGSIQKIINSNVDGVMWHFFHTPQDKHSAFRILNVLERSNGINIWPNYNTRWHFDDKISQILMLQGTLIKTPRTFISWNKQEAIEYITNMENYPYIFKLSVGAGSSNIIKISNIDQARALVDLMFDIGVYPNTPTLSKIENNEKYIRFANNIKPNIISNLLSGKAKVHRIDRPNWQYELQKGYVFLQEFLPTNEFDYRVTIIGDRAFAFRRMNRANDYRASGSGKIDYSLESIPIDIIKIAFKVSNQFKFQSMAYDFLVDSNGDFNLIEISYGYVNEAVYNCPGHWNSSLEFIKGNLWPEYCHVIDFIKSK